MVDTIITLHHLVNKDPLSVKSQQGEITMIVPALVARSWAEGTNKLRYAHETRTTITEWHCLVWYLNATLQATKPN